MSITREEVAEVARQWIAAWDNKDVTTIADIEEDTKGYGYRALGWRDVSSKEARVQQLERFFGNLEAWGVELEDVQTSVIGDVGLAWGVFIESFHERGKPPERAKVRFSSVFTKGTTGWKQLQYHRDIQPFDDHGSYPRALTVTAPSD